VSPTMAEVLELPEVQRGHPTLLAGEESLERRVRWVHVLEVTDVEGLLRGGELVLTTGVGLPNDSAELRRHVGALHASGVSGVVLQLGHRWAEPPKALIGAAAEHGMPLVALRTKVPFVAITESVHVSIVNAQLAELQASQRLHQVFMRLGLGAGTAAEILHEVAELTRTPIVLENLSHRVIEADTAGRDREQALIDWERRSRRAKDEDRTSVVGPERWLIVPVGAADARWGRLIMLATAAPSRLDEMALERAAEALVLRRLIAADESVFERAAESGLLEEVRSARYRSAHEMAVRLQAAGVPVLGRGLQAIVVACAGSSPSLAEQVDAVRHAIERSGVRAIAADRSGQVAALLSFDLGDDRLKRLRLIAGRVRADLTRRHPGVRVTVAAGRMVDTLDEAPTSFREAEQAAVAAPRTPSDGGADDVVTLRDVGIRGLIALLRDDPRLQLFVEDSLGPLLDRDSRGPSGRELLDVLDAYLAERGNKSSAAARLHMSRPAFYSRLELLERELDVDLEDAQSVLALHFALVAHDVLSRR
jgi:purine catabolism regulator